MGKMKGVASDFKASEILDRKQIESIQHIKIEI